jgi:hypothetical protein
LLGFAAVANANQVFAWGYDLGDGTWNGGGGSGGCEYGRCGENIGLGEPAGPGSYDNGFYAGEQDAIYDHNNNIVYNPVGQCYTCHSELYWHGFHEGYNKQYNSYTNTEQTTSQGSSINIYGNNNYVNTNQYSSQSAGNILKSIGQGLCNLAGGCRSGSGEPGPGPTFIQESYP